MPLWSELLAVPEDVEPTTVEPGEAVVEVLRQPNRKLQPGEVAELVASYVAGATIRSLGKQHGMHQQTVKAHLRRRGIELRPVLGVRDEDLALVLELHQAGWGARRIGARVGVGQTAVWGAVRRASRRPTL